MVHIPTEYVDMILWILDFRILKNIKAVTKYQVEKYGTGVWLRMHLIQTRVKRSVHLICKSIYFRRVYFSFTSSNFKKCEEQLSVFCEMWWISDVESFYTISISVLEFDWWVDKFSNAADNFRL
jgi:hypothetical protein